MHTDAVQAACWLDLREVTPHVDLLSLSAHKFGGPKGVGVLVERGGPRVDPLIIGGGQERERRSGTQNTAGIVATAVALRLTDAERDAEAMRLADLRNRLVKGLQSRLDGVLETVPPERKVAGSAHVCILGVESEALLYLLDEADVCASAASACASGAMEPSHVLAAMGVDRSAPSVRCGSRSATPRPRPTSTGRSRSSSPPWIGWRERGSAMKVMCAMSGASTRPSRRCCSSRPATTSSGSR